MSHIFVHQVMKRFERSRNTGNIQKQHAQKTYRQTRRLHKLITKEHFLLCLSWFITRYETNGKSNTRSDRIKLGFLYVALWREDSHSWWLRREPKKREVWVQVTPPDRSLLGQKKATKKWKPGRRLDKKWSIYFSTFITTWQRNDFGDQKRTKVSKLRCWHKEGKKFSLIKPNALDGVSSRA